MIGTPAENVDAKLINSLSGDNLLTAMYRAGTLSPIEDVSGLIVGFDFRPKQGFGMRVTGSSGDDNIVTGDGDDIVLFTAGQDTLDAAGGIDTLDFSLVRGATV